MLEPGKAQSKISIPYFEGINSAASFNIGKKTEFVHVENARSKTIGTIEKRQGQTVLGTTTSNGVFVTTANYGLFSFQNNNNQGLYRISVAQALPVLEIDVKDTVSVSSSGIIFGQAFSSSGEIQTLTVNVKDSVNITDIFNENTGTVATIYYINSSNQWVPLTGSGANIPGGIFDYTYAEGCTFLVNQNAPNRYIGTDGVTVTTSTTGSGHLYNTPPASRINFYKNRLYLADYIYSFNRYKTTVLRSSYPMGIVALVNSDYDATLPTTVKVTDNKYFYTDSGANSYEIYRGTTKITTITVTTINETSLIVTGTITGLLASDEIWITGTYNGPKIFRWVNNPTTTGKDIKQYDTFKLSGGENDEITMLTNIGNVMLISNKSTMSSWNDYTLENFDAEIGCVSKKGYTKLRGILYFLHYTGVYSTSGGASKIISNKIEKYISGATKNGLENSAAGKKGNSIFFTLGDVTLYNGDGSIMKILRDVCAEYNIVQENWYIHTNVKSSEFVTFVENSNSDRLEFIDTSGNHAVKEFLQGTTDDGEVIHFRVDTMKLTTNSTNFEYSSKLIALLTEVERGTSMQVFINLENGEGYFPIEGTMGKGLSVIKFNNKDNSRGKPPYTRLVSISIRDSSPQLCKISRMTLVTLPTTDEDDLNTKE